MTNKWREMVDGLFEAAKHGRVEDVRRLLQAGVQVDPRDCCLRTPLMFAALARHLPVVHALLAGARTRKSRIS